MQNDDPIQKLLDFNPDSFWDFVRQDDWSVRAYNQALREAINLIKSLQQITNEQIQLKQQLSTQFDKINQELENLQSLTHSLIHPSYKIFNPTDLSQKNPEQKPPAENKAT